MILHGAKKTVLKKIIKYFVETTGKEYNDFILAVDRTQGKSEDSLEYEEWLAKKMMYILNEKGITYRDILENKDTINATINSDSSRDEGEFYTPELWCADGRSYLKNILGDRWGEVYIWDASAGSGNLMRTEGYPEDKLFLSSLLEADIPLLQQSYSGATCFQLDFLNGIDRDDNNLGFSSLLPPKLIEVLQSNKPIVFYMNPPYKVLHSKNTDLGAYMSDRGMAKCALDLFHQFMYRMVSIKQFYGLTDVTLGIFGPITMFHSKMIEPLFNEFKKEFTFNSGMCFDAGDFANTSESVGWIVGYTCWTSKKVGELDKPIVLEAKTISPEGEPEVIGSRLVTSVDINLHNWCKPTDVIRVDDELPTLTTFSTFTGKSEKIPSHALGYMMSSNFVLRATRRACTTTLPSTDAIPITKENFWRCVASIGARRTYVTKQNPYNNCQYYSAPNEHTEGYQQWLADALLIFLYDFDAQHASYRDLEFMGAPLNQYNPFFPISKEDVRGLITDENILRDLDESYTDNSFVLEQITNSRPHFSPEGEALYKYVIELFATSLHGDSRASFGYDKWTVAWDAGLVQLRAVEGLLTKEQHEKYAVLLNRLKAKQYDGIYKHGFLMDAISSNDSIDDEEELEDIDDSDALQELESIAELAYREGN